MKKLVSRIVKLSLLGYLFVHPVFAFDSFVIKEIKLQGLQRIAAGTVFNYLPVQVGDILDENRSTEAIRALFKTGFFHDIQLEHRGDLLIITVEERPAIASIEISGNKEIDTDTLKEALNDVGLVENRVFDRSILDKVEQELRRQYFSLGKYGVKIHSNVELQERNRVDVTIDIAEGEAARITSINVVGNFAFDQDDLLADFQLSEPTAWSFLSDNDKYSKQKLRGDLEVLRSYYLDRGYINFNIQSTQVSITPDKRDIYITVNVSEGEKFSIKEIKLVGEMVVPKEELMKLITIKPGSTFSRKDVTLTSNRINERLGNEGYAFANVNAIPDINIQKQEVTLTYFVDPGKLVYVRRVSIVGNENTLDTVIRREFRQFEGARFTPKKLERTRIRIQRLGYFDDVKLDTPKVPGTADQVDVTVKVSEGSTGSLQAGLGYGEPNGLIFNAKVTLNNFVGTGKRIALEANNDRISTVYSFSYTNPYYTQEGVSRGISVFFRETNLGQARVGNFSTDDKGVSVNYGFPLSELNTARLGVGAKNTNIKVDSADAPQTFLDWVVLNGDSFDTITLTPGWTYDTRNRVFLADKGVLQRLSAQIALPGGDIEYFKLTHDQEWDWPLGKGFIFKIKSLLAYGDGYSGTDELPFFENYYAGGGRSVRGFESNSLGPRDCRAPMLPAESGLPTGIDRCTASQVGTGKIIGGNIKVVGNLEVIFPLPFVENSRSFRLSTFVDTGNVFDGSENFDIGELRSSYGISALWVTPVGVLTFSWGWIIDRRPEDDSQVFNFFIGAPF